MPQSRNHSLPKILLSPQSGWLEVISLLARICTKFPAQTIYWTHTLTMRNCIPTTWRKETQETMGSWMGPADAKEIRETKESILEQTLGRGQEPWTPGVASYPWALGLELEGSSVERTGRLETATDGGGLAWGTADRLDGELVLDWG